MDMKISSQGDRVIIELAGSIDDVGAGELKRQLSDLNTSELNEVVFDFAAVTFMGSAGVGKFLLFYKNLANQGGKVTFRNLSKEIHTMLKVVKLDKIFNLVVSE